MDHSRKAFNTWRRYRNSRHGSADAPGLTPDTDINRYRAEKAKRPPKPRKPKRA